MSETNTKPTNFIRNIIDEDLASGKHERIVTRFPPEPNGYLHIGHAKSICLNFGIAQDYPGAICNLRFDDTNPQKEEVEFVDSIQDDVRWLGFDWDDRRYFASDYFDRLYEFAQRLIKKELAFVCDLNAEQMREYRGTLTEPGKESPYRSRSVEENLDLLARMKNGEFEDGERTLRARIDMAHGNMNMRDPVLYRIKKGVHHHQTGDNWNIYPSYDFTHPLSDALECVTHSLCTLEFEDHRPLYEWMVENVGTDCQPRQIEFSRLNLEYTVLSKRYLTRLVTEGHVNGWDDPRMPTVAGLRRRGYTPDAIVEFCDRIGVTKSDNVIEMAVLEGCIREDLDAHAPRRMAVLDPIKVTISNYPEEGEEWLDAPSHPKNTEMGSRKVPMSRELWIDRADFREQANKKYKRLVLDGEVRLRNSYVIRADEAVKDADGNIVELVCSYDPDTLGRNPEGRKVRGVIHWVSARHGVPAEVRIYDRLFVEPSPGAGGADFVAALNPDSLKVLTNCIVEPALKEDAPGQRYQFEREGYFWADPVDSGAGQLVFNRIVALRDSWVKIEKNQP